MAVEHTTREWLESIDEQIETLIDRVDATGSRLEEHSGKFTELQMLVSQSATVTRAIQLAMTRGAETVTSASRWIRLACTVVALSALTAAGATVYLVLR